MAPAERYGYAVARLRAMSGRLLEEALLQRILESEDLDSALKVLGETVYSSWLMELKGNGEFDRAIEAELLHVYGEVQKFVPDPALVHLCRLPYDFHNVKVLLKSALLVREGGERRFDLLTSLGNIPSDDLIMAMESEDFRLLPFGLHLLVPHCFSVWEQTKDILEVEKLLDEGLFAAMRKTASATGIEAASLWVRGKIDAENVRNLLRMKRMDMETGSAALFPGKSFSLSTPNRWRAGEEFFLSPMCRRRFLTFRTPMISILLSSRWKRCSTSIPRPLSKAPNTRLSPRRTSFPSCGRRNWKQKIYG